MFFFPTRVCVCFLLRHDSFESRQHCNKLIIFFSYDMLDAWFNAYTIFIGNVYHKIEKYGRTQTCNQRCFIICLYTYRSVDSGGKEIEKIEHYWISFFFLNKISPILAKILLDSTTTTANTKNNTANNNKKKCVPKCVSDRWHWWTIKLRYHFKVAGTVDGQS